MTPSIPSLSNQSPMQAAYDLAKNQSSKAQEDIFTKVRKLQSSSLQNNSKVYPRSSRGAAVQVSISQTSKDLARQNAVDQTN